MFCRKSLFIFVKSRALYNARSSVSVVLGDWNNDLNNFQSQIVPPIVRKKLPKDFISKGLFPCNELTNVLKAVLNVFSKC